ncbi:MAG: DUF4331 family protein [Candidatus Eremiobacteraeota bacterium]|nr:DUF4331 family protein [Candidatus Eremiobacteraeota bacterium]
MFPKIFERPLRFAAVGITVCALLYAARPASPSDHQDTLQLVSRPGADITDLYVFPAKDPSDVVFALDVHPLIPRGMSSTVSFDPGVLYQIKVDTVGDYRAHVALQFKAAGAGASQRIAFYGPAAAGAGMLSSIGPLLGTTTYDTVASLPHGVRLFAGARKDPFYFDLTQFFKIDPDRNYKNQPSPPAPSASFFLPADRASDTLANFNVLSLIVEMPRSMLENATNKGRINVWATASVAAPGSQSYRQIERWGRPAVKEALERFADHDVTNHSEPWADPTLKSNIASYMTAPKPGGAGRSPAIAAALVKVLIPDEMQVDLSAGGHATYLGVETKGKSGLPVGIVRVVPDAGLKGLKKSLRNGARQFGGRDPDSPVIDLSLGAIYGSILSKVGLAADDRKETPCLTSDNVKPSAKTLSGFPYLASPV